MAFVRWRGTCAPLLATIYQDGRSRQICLANFHGAYSVTPGVRAAVTAAYPTVRVDWAAVQRAVAADPRGTPPLGPAPLTWLAVETALLEWAASDRGTPGDRGRLRIAAAVLEDWRVTDPTATDT